ncbi:MULTISPECIES: HvfX family Cu-binding RiPP maturation protein [Methylococcus]|uniref:DoxX family protein n=1 Tax=Methylococcus capsulatus TaxID=414 RepID=A0ABZ2F4K9_METCP|nr:MULTISPECIES: DoxX family protein [Methylococcus]MDF9391963.1 DoxX family protein [Methylococcus capsulatus]
MNESFEICRPDASREDRKPLGPSRLRWLSGWLESQASGAPPLLLRLLLAWEFWEAGLMKLYGENWFADLSFPFPFNLFPPSVNWWLATGFELLGAIALALGVATRLFSLALAVLTVVAIAAVHWPSDWASLSDLAQGYAITDEGHGNFKLPLMYLAMLLPLLFGGAGRYSLDAWVSGRARRCGFNHAQGADEIRTDSG